MIIEKTGLLFALLTISIGIIPAFALTELERSSIENPRLENAFGAPIADTVNVYQQILISSDVKNLQNESQTFVYIVQIKDKSEMTVSVGWVSGALAPNQKFSTSLSWIPEKEGEYVAEVFVWEELLEHNALSNFKTLKINVS
ncbi:hypothetical protein [Nitrosopumilus sp.]|uniref:hypothetical protein n=1 Tax=Nitrosopumilus sp. TaxID=2024843 RepID=UPI003B5C3F4E